MNKRIYILGNGAGKPYLKNIAIVITVEPIGYPLLLSIFNGVFKDALTYTENNVKKYFRQNFLESVLKFLSIFMIKIYYETNIKMFSFHIKCVNCNKEVGCILKNKSFRKSFHVFVKVVLFQNDCISWII